MSLIARCHKAAILKPNDFTIIAEWEKEEIPLTIVVKSIDECCDESHGNVLSIEQLQKKVNDEFSKWLAGD